MGMAAGVAAFVVAALTACTPGSPAPTSQTSTGGPGEVDQLLPTMSRSATAPAPTPSNPLDEYLIFFDATMTPEEAQQQTAEQELIKENYVAQCMKQQGFDYIPWVSSYMPEMTEGDWHPEDRAWVERHGYGQLDQALVLPQNTGAVPIPENPNLPYLDSLSESELDAYHAAMDGVSYLWDGNRTGDFGVTPEQWAATTWEDYGCTGYAQHQYEVDYPEMNLTTSDQFQPLFEAYQDFLARVRPFATPLSAQSPLLDEMIPVDAEWSSCMAAAGYLGLEQQPDGHEFFMTQYYQSSVYPEQFGQGVDPSRILDDEALHAKEVEIALADFDCRAEVNYDDRKAQVILDAQLAFVADHLDELKAYKAAVEQGQITTP
jgi:hypothetical protein